MVRAVERRAGFVRITEPVEGWVFRSMLTDTCEAPPALPAVPLGSRTYLLLPEIREDARPGTSLPGPSTMDPEFVAMRFSFRNRRPIDPPLPITLVTESGSCERRATRRVLLVGTCPSGSPQSDYSSAVEALEVNSCPELFPATPQEMGVPFVVGLVGRHEGARIATWPRTEAPPTAGQREVLERERRRIIVAMEPEYRTESSPEMPATMQRFEGSPWVWGFLDEEYLLFHGDALMDKLDMTAGFPMRIAKDAKLLVGIGDEG